jgi:formylglycine-generating enzyme required for sulfatase activity
MRDVMYVMMVMWLTCEALLVHAADESLRPATLTSPTSAQMRSLRFEPVRVVDPTTQQLLVNYDASYALIIGCSDYQHLPDLPGVRTDVTAIHQALEQHSFQVQTLMNPTGDVLEQTVKQFIAQRGFQVHARLLLYFAGHGHTERRGGHSHGYLVPVDAPLPAEDIIGFRARAVDLNDFVTRANHAESKHVLVAFDSCFSGRIFESRALPSAYVLQMVRDPVRLFLTSGSVHEPVPDQSEFRRAFVAGLAGAADSDGDGFILGNEFFAYVRKRVINAGAINQQPQTPQWRALPAGIGPVGDVVFITPTSEIDQGSQTTQASPSGGGVPHAAPESHFAALDEVVRQEHNVDFLMQEAEARARIADVAMQVRIWQIALDRLPSLAASTKDDQARAEVRQRLAAAQALLDRPAWASASGTDQFGRWATLRVGVAEQRLRWIAPGDFIMGSFPTDPERNVDEVPHRVSLTKGFWLADTELTQALWLEVMGANPSRFQGNLQRPVEQVNWQDCHEFFKQLRDRVSSAQPRLPTEAEWEYAARAGTSTMTYAGNFRYAPGAPRDLSALESIAWFGTTMPGDEVEWQGAGGIITEAHPTGVGTWAVGHLQPNAWGLYDMLGNVWEWCADYYGAYPTAPIIDPRGPTMGTQRVVRGGSFFEAPWNCRAAQRGKYPEDWRANVFSVGVRMAISAE